MLTVLPEPAERPKPNAPGPPAAPRDDQRQILPDDRNIRGAAAAAAALRGLRRHASAQHAQLLPRLQPEGARHDRAAPAAPAGARARVLGGYWCISDHGHSHPSICRTVTAAALQAQRSLPVACCCLCFEVNILPRVPVRAIRSFGTSRCDADQTAARHCPRLGVP